MPEQKNFITENKYPTLYVKNFGKIKEAEIELAPFTLFIGDNNSGKSYLLNLIWGLQHKVCYDSSFFVTSYKEYIKEDQAYRDIVNKLNPLKGWTRTNDKKEINFDETDINNIMILINKIIHVQKDNLIKNLFNSSIVTLDKVSIFIPKGINMTLSVEILENFNLDTSTTQDKYHINVYIGEKQKKFSIVLTLNEDIIEHSVHAIVRFMLYTIFPSMAEQSSIEPAPFLPTSRTGFLLTYKELAKKAISNTYEIQMKNDSISSNGKLLQSTISFMQMLLSLDTRYSNGQYNNAMAKKIVDYMENEIIEGKLEMHPETGEFLYTPNEIKIPLKMHMSSAVVTELAPLILYLKYHSLADVMFMEEPEISLHPELQQKITRVLIKLLNCCNQQLFISTHSDTIIQYINNMIKLSNNPPDRQKELFAKFEYDKNDMIHQDKIRMYQFDVDKVTQKTNVINLESSEYGFEAKTFNKALEAITKEIYALQENVVTNEDEE